MNGLKVLIDVAASRRLTRLIVKDEITRPIRESHAITSHEKLSYLFNCPFCVSVYTGALVAVSSMVFPRASKIALYGLALAEFQATLTELDNQREALVDDFGPSL